MTHKFCRGPSHPPGGELVSVEEFNLYKSGARKGKPISICRKCRKINRCQTVPPNVYVKIIDEMKTAGYTQKAIAHAMGANDTQVSEWALGRRRMFKSTFRRLLKARQTLIIDPKYKQTVQHQ